MMEPTNSDKIVSYWVGVDIGQSRDYTAVAVIEKLLGYRTNQFNSAYHLQAFDNLLKEAEQKYTISWLERLPLGMSYPQMVDIIADRMRNLPVANFGLLTDAGISESRLCVDATGVGRAVIDLLNAKGFEPLAITITGGDTVSHENKNYRVPKRDLVTCVKILQQQRRLKVVSGLPEGILLQREMENFKYKINLDTGHDSYNAWRESDHDDLVLAVAVGLWSAFNEAGAPLKPMSQHSYIDEKPEEEANSSVGYW